MLLTLMKKIHLSSLFSVQYKSLKNEAGNFVNISWQSQENEVGKILLGVNHLLSLPTDPYPI